MFAYVANVSYRELGAETFLLLAYSQGTRRDVERQLVSEGWQVHRVSTATKEDVAELPHKDDFLKTIKAEAARKRELEARKRAESQQRQREEQRRQEAARQRVRQTADERAVAALTAPRDETVIQYEAPPQATPPAAAIVNTLPRMHQTREYKVLTQKDKWFSQKFDPSLLESALNSYAAQGWRIRVADTAAFPGMFTGNRQELIAVLERGGDHVMFEYKVLTQKDKWFSGKFDPQRLEAAINAYAQQGWQVVVATTASFPGFLANDRDELILVMERRKH
jgi:hypothetical protein